MTRISTNRDAVTYLDSLFVLSRRGFSTLQAAREAILQIVTEQLTTRSSFFSVIRQESGKFEVIAAHNESGNCNVEVGTVVLARLLATQVEHEQELTGRKWAEVELSRALRALQMANEQREYLKQVQSDFVSIVNHEFRTTLTAIQGFSELMREEEFSIHDVKEYAYDINADARRLSRMINQLLDLDQMKSGQVPLHLEQVDLNEIIVAVVQRIRPTAPGHQIHLQLAEHFPLLAGDYDRLSLVVTNLLNNAIKYSPAGGEIRLGSCVEDASVRVFVQDRGVGIPAHALNQVFEMHAWAYESNGPRYIKGTGLGLPIVRQIVQMHNGKTWAESVQDKGSIFHFTLPISNEDIQ